MTESDTGVMIFGGEGGDEVSLLEILDHVLNSGVVIHGTIIISLAGVDLIYLGLNVILTGIETVRRSNENKSLQQPKSVARPCEGR
ncbi:gas vesicle protein GVPa [Candidatus Koribacter versatilis Ellin345]|uniref:Gas vesicle protein GVPa n=1 Tax=Koribacter versatilis (strain Ellin345) TaxID=204669 RepID=Q1INZ1_KORVE|nr:gas vesicle protein [Candidatus Koribacter versatilis]ABF41409.1 gas vesicle protein GVPa [Candidatus Koribacter versatilis Ellin345]